MRFVIGLTGGIGSGKSTVLDVLEREYGAQIVQEDSLGKTFMVRGGAAYGPIVREFGAGVLDHDGNIDNKKLGAIVFADPDRMKVLEGIIHPLVLAEVDRLVEAAEGVIVVESAIPVQAQFERFCDEIWYVRVPEVTRIRRLMLSRGYTRKKCLDAMRSQLSDSEFMQLADRVIDNGGLMEDTEQAVRRIMEEVGVKAGRII